ncbi:MAG: MDR family MFS transporter [Streptosporangiales bacterium]
MTTSPPTLRSRGLFTVLPGLLIAMLLAQLDMTIVGTAMPRIVGDLGGAEHLAWVVTAYTLAVTVVTPLYGKLGDMFGRKKLLMVGIALFITGSALAGLSQDMGQLIAFRALQGLGAGGLIVGVMATIGELAAPRERAKLQGYFAATMAVSMIGGPLLGGFITDHLSWRWTFYINLPIGVLALALIATTLHLPGRTSRHRIDFAGTGLLGAAATALVLVTTWGGTQYAWSSATIIGLAVLGATALAAFLLVESRAAEPILPLRLFRKRNFSVSSTLAFVVGFAMFGAITFLPLFMQTAQGASATASGALLMPMMLGAMVMSLVSGQIIGRTGRYRALPIVGSAVMTAGLFLLSQLTADSSNLSTTVFMVVLGLGMGTLMQLTRLLPQNSVELADMGVASSTPQFFQTIGGSFGVSLFGAVFAGRLADSLGRASVPGNAGAGLDPARIADLPDAVREAVVHGVAYATQGVFFWATCVAAVAFLLSWALESVPLRSQLPKPAEGGEDRVLATVE